MIVGLKILFFALYDSKAESIRAKAIGYFGKSVRVVTPNDLAQNQYIGDILVDDIDKAFTALLADFVRSNSFSVAGMTVTEE